MLLLWCLAACADLSAQHVYSHTDRQTYRQLKHSTKLNPHLKQVAMDYFSDPDKSLETPIRMLIQADPGQVEALALAADATIQSRVGDIFSITLPIGRLNVLAAHPGLIRAEYFPAEKVETNADSAAILSFVPPVWNGDSPLNRAYTGKGVVVGIIDSGMDYEHPAFRWASDQKRSRILRFWDQTSFKGVPPLGYTDGSEWTLDMIEAELADNPPNFIDSQDEIAHGTHVGAIAAGNLGIATQADLMVVGVNLQAAAPINDIFSSILDGASYIYREAKAEGRPCVINASLGIPLLPTDGSTLLEQGIKNLVQGNDGRAFVAACGNSGQNTNHWGGFPLTTDEQWVYLSADIFNTLLGSFQGAPTPTQYSISMIVPEADAATTEMKFVVDSTEPGAELFPGLVTSVNPVKSTDSTGWMTAQQVLNAGDTTFTLKHGDGGFAGRIRLTSSLSANSDFVQIEMFLNDSATIELNGFTTIIEDVDMYRLKTRGTGQLDAIASDQAGVTFVSDTGNVYSADYTNPDNLYTIAVPSSGTHVIGVGSYCNRQTVPGGGGGIFGPAGAPYPQGTLSSFSSRGPTTDGRVKPDINAPGENVSSAHSQYATQQQPAGTGDWGQFAYQSGTSMSAPVVAGIIALMFERDQDADYQTVYDNLINNAYTDAFTISDGSLPNNHWGHGKADAFAAVQAMEDDPLQVGLPEEAPELNAALYPNPTSGELQVLLPPDASSSVQYQVLNLSGQALLQGEQTSQTPSGMDPYSYLSNVEINAVESLYERYKEDPNSVDASWQKFFEGFDLAGQYNGNGNGSASAAAVATVSPSDSKLQKEQAVLKLIEAYRVRGHLFAKINPIMERRQFKPGLDLERFGLSESNLDEQ
ncbi:MAG: S8 family serine peptidase, partial [Bacteroidota bacterium]